MFARSAPLHDVGAVPAEQAVEGDRPGLLDDLAEEELALEHVQVSRSAKQAFESAAMTPRSMIARIVMAIVTLIRFMPA